MLCRLRRSLCRNDAVRALSTGEISTALRPFYFTVHPDLFGQFPTQRTVNENSLKQLSLLLESLQQQRPIKPTTLPFYLRSKDEKEVKADKIKEPVKDNKFKYRYDPRVERDGVNFSDLEDDPFFMSIFMRRKMNAEPDTFKAYVDKHVNEAHIKLEACRPVREEVKKLEKILCQDLGLKDITWDCGWNIAHYRGCLLAFQALARHHPEQMDVLKNRTLVFANGTGISLEGSVMLNSGEVRHNWLDLIKNVKKYDPVLLRLPAFEKAVSRVLLDIKIGRRVLYMCRKFMPKVMVGQYESQLRQLTTTLSDYRGRSKYPSSWPPSLSSHEIVIEAEAGPLMLSPTGQFIVPSSCPGFLLVNFITDNLDEATKRLNHYNKIKHVERELHDRTIKELGLLALNKDDSITPDLMVKSCENLLKHKSTLGPILEGVMLWITHYYSVMSDGVLCIPWDWKL
ncbi:T-cell activation inhibitor, mitochondrial isoform X3 [Microplitis demolitor]|uniref:T-cell activation inhibitor, mitochondrial isoform X3 n=1 Tax=Microplitis demolitor TaxID=69319 RepID=UPI0004CD8B08|nr:T-cell activation inhibitor, mitochondrial isoform X3 [Microplitis demolitor]